MAPPAGFSEKIRQSWTELVDGSTPALPLNRTLNEQAEAIFSGAFNPLHDGHREMAEVAAGLLDTTVAFEISIANVDKPALDFSDAACRVGQFAADQPIWLTRAATFVEKSKLFPCCTFVVGADTLFRIGQPQYYGGSGAAVDAAIDQFVVAECRFLVFGRLWDGSFKTIEQCGLPGRLMDLCRQVSESDFRMDVCSRDLRS
jgi:hypothetical protein